MDTESLNQKLTQHLTFGVLRPHEDLVVVEEDEEIPKPTYAQLLVLLEQRKPSDVGLLRAKKHHNPTCFAQNQLEQSQRHHFERLNLQKSLWAESSSDGVALSATSMVS